MEVAVPQGQGSLQVVFLASGEPFALADDPNLTPAMEVDVSQGQSPLQIIVLAPDEPNPFAVADDPDVSPAWVSMREYLPWVSTTPDTDGHRSSKRARVAAASEAILPEVSGRSREGEECAICLQDFAAEETLRGMPCSHAFHRHCISKWLCRSAASYPPLPSPRSTATTRWWNG